MSRLHSKFSPTVRDVVWQQLLPPRADPEFQQVLSELNSTQFEKREAASQWLSEHAGHQRDRIVFELAKSELNSEIASRLRKALKTVLSEDQFESYNYVQEQNLAEDPAYLLWIVEQLDSNPVAEWIPDDRRADLRELLFNRLTELTGQTLQPNRQVWLDWLERTGETIRGQPRGPDSRPLPVSLPLPEGKLNELADYLHPLFPLKVESSNLVLDRERWAELFDRRTVSQLLDETEKYLEQQNLPRSWLSVDRDALRGIDYPQLLMKRMEDRLAEEPADDREAMIRLSTLQMRRNSPPIRNVQFKNNRVTALLEVDEGVFPDSYGRVTRSNRIEPAEKTEDVLVLQVAETTRPNQWLLLGAWPDRSMRVIVRVDQVMVHINQSADGECTADVAAGDGTFHQVFRSAAEMLSDPTVERTVMPFLAAFGVRVDND
jgi:hypothetical protein